MPPAPGSPVLVATTYQSNPYDPSDELIDQNGNTVPTAGPIDIGAVQTTRLVVNTTADSTDAGATCLDNSGNGTEGTCSLRDALGVANTAKATLPATILFNTFDTTAGTNFSTAQTIQTTTSAGCQSSAAQPITPSWDLVIAFFDANLKPSH